MNVSKFGIHFQIKSKGLIPVSNWIERIDKRNYKIDRNEWSYWNENVINRLIFKDKKYFHSSLIDLLDNNLNIMNSMNNINFHLLHSRMYYSQTYIFKMVYKSSNILKSNEDYMQLNNNFNNCIYINENNYKRNQRQFLFDKRKFSTEIINVDKSPNNNCSDSNSCCHGSSNSCSSLSHQKQQEYQELNEQQEQEIQELDEQQYESIIKQLRDQNALTLHPIEFYLENGQKFKKEGNILRSFRYFLQAAYLGSKEAHQEVGKLYLFDSTIDSNEDEVSSENYNIVKKNVDGEDKVYYVDSKSILKMRFVEKIKLLKEESDQLDAQLLSQEVLKIQFNHSRKKAYFHLREAIKDPSPYIPSLILLGKQLVFENTREQNIEEGLKLLIQASTYSGEANYLIGQILFNGIELGQKAKRKNIEHNLEKIDPDVTMAMIYFEKSALLEDRNGLYFYGVCLYWGENGVKQNLKEGLSMIEKASQLNHPDACYFLSSYFKEKQNENKSQYFFEKAIELKNVDALQLKAEQFLKQGHDELALRYYEEASRQGSRDSTFCVGVLLYRKKMFLEAFQKYSKAARMGSIPALECMIDLATKGQGISLDPNYIEHLKEVLDNLKKNSIL